MDGQEYEKPKSELQKRVERREGAVLDSEFYEKPKSELQKRVERREEVEFLALKERMTNGDMSITDTDRNRAVELAKQFGILPKV